MKNRVGQYLKGVKNKSARAKVRALVRKKLGSITALNPIKRRILQDCIFAVENKIESKGGGHPDHPTVVQLRYARNLVLDDLGLNEYPKRKNRS